MNVNTIQSYLNKEVDIFIDGGVTFRGVAKHPQADSSTGPTPITSLVTIEPTRQFEGMFGLVTVETASIKAIRYVLKGEK